MSILEEVLSILISILLVVWWLSSSPSILLVSLLLSSILSGGWISATLGCKIQAFLVILTIVGGLFVLISFVILSYPKDYDKSSVFPSLLLTGGVILIFSQNWDFYHISDDQWSSFELESVSSNLSFTQWSFIFFLLILLISLKLVDSMMGKEKGSMFSPL